MLFTKRADCQLSPCLLGAPSRARGSQVLAGGGVGLGASVGLCL